MQINNLGLEDKAKESWLKEIGVYRHKPIEYTLRVNEKFIMTFTREYLENTPLKEIKKGCKEIMKLKTNNTDETDLIIFD